MNSTSHSTPTVHRIEIQRLLRHPTAGLSAQQREALLEHLEAGSFADALLVVEAHGDLGASGRVVTALVERMPATLSAPAAFQTASLLLQRLGVDAYAELVQRAMPRFRDRDDAAEVRRYFIAGLRGSQTFDRIVAADTSLPPPEEAAPSLSLELVELKLRYDDKNRSRRLIDIARANPARAVHIWCVARGAGDRATEEALHPEILRRVDFSRVAGEGVPRWHWRLRDALLDWLREPSSDAEVRADLVARRADEAHDAGCSWDLILWYLRDAPRELTDRLRARSLNGDDAHPEAVGVLAPELATGSPEAWTRFFRWAKRNLPRGYLEGRKLLREGRLPDDPTGEFWRAFLAAWEAVREAESEQIAFAEEGIARHLRPDHHPWERDDAVRRVLPQVFPRLGAEELLERILERAACVETAPALVAALRDAPKRLSDPRIAAFGPFVRSLPHEALPPSDSLNRLDDAAMMNFLALHGECGPSHVREWVRHAMSEDRAGTLWFVERPWIEAIVDDALREELRQGLGREKLDALVEACDRCPAWLSREWVREEAQRRPDEWLRVERLPDWMDDVLIDRVRNPRAPDELRQLFIRFRDKAAFRGPLFEGLLGLARQGGVGQAVNLLGALLDSRTAWDRHGAEIVYELIRQGRASETLALVLGDPTDYSTGDATDAASTSARAVAIHLAFARGILRWAGEQLAEGDAAGVERALMAINLLDPPPLFTRALRRFAESEALQESVRHWIASIHRIAKSGGGSDADMRAVFQCIEELTAPPAS